MKKSRCLVWLIAGWLVAHLAVPPVWSGCLDDSDGDGVCDANDLCPNTIPSVTVDSDGCPPAAPGDFDGDGDVDLEDFEAVSACWLGPDVPVSSTCVDADSDFDLDVDLLDLDAYHDCFSGADVPANPDCVSPTAGIVAGCLRIVDTAASTELSLRLQVGVPTILGIDVGDDGSADFRFDRVSFDCIEIHARGGNDLVRIDEVNGAFTDTERTTLYGGDGNDTLHGGVGAEALFGGDGNDVIDGNQGADLLHGDDGDDTITGGDGNDEVHLGPGNDRFIWNPGDDTDFTEGDSGVDTVEVNGSNGTEVFTVTANGIRVRFDRINPTPFSIDIGTSENMVLNANGGNDSFNCTGNLAALIQITADGGPGNDTLLGSNGADVLLGGDDNDFIDGQQGNDTAFLGAGDDVFQWDPGDGSDIIDGGADRDTLLFNGSNGSEIFSLSPFGMRLRFTRNLGSIVMDVDDVEEMDLNALGGTDTVTVNDVTGTDVTQVNVDLAGTIGGSTGDSVADQIIVNGTSGDDALDVVGAGASLSVFGLVTQVNIANSEGANDSLVINALGGIDGVTATTLPAGVIKLTLDGGSNQDTLLGSQGADVLLGGDGNDFIIGDNGQDTAFMGADADVFQWNPGDGNDVVEGQDGSDTLLFFGAGIDENINVTANGGRVLFVRNIANVMMDLDDVETIDFRALGGADNILVGDLSGTDLTELGLDLAGPNGGGDGAADSITVIGTNGDDVFGAAGDAAGVNVFGLQATVNILLPEQASDLLTLNAQGGDDVVNAASLEVDAIRLHLNGGLGEDILLGGEGVDLLNGGDGDDTALMGDGNDTFIWNPGDDNDTLEGQAGFDTMLFNGAVIAEQINVFANGDRVLFTRDIANVAMDLNDVESIDFTARGGADTITIHNLEGSDVNEINLNLESVPDSGTGDGQPDSVIVTGTIGDDVALADGGAGGTSVQGLTAQVNINGAEAANDRLTINAQGGHDVVDASGLAVGAIQLTANGGTGDDILLGGAGSDNLAGGDHDDVLLGGPGVDVVDGGLGANIIIQDGGTATTAIVTVFGDETANTITISRDAGGNILSDGVPIPGATVANTALIRVFGRGGDDVITLDEAMGALPAAAIYGGAGLDVLTGGMGSDQIFGGVDPDTLLGNVGFDFIFGGAGDDTLTGGDLDDLVFGETGDDDFIWNPGDDTDLNEGGNGTDTVEVNGGNGTEVFTVTSNGPRVRFDRIDPAPFAIDIGTCEKLVLNANGGNDRLSCTGNLAALIQITADGGPGNDTLVGSNGADVLLGGDDNDFIDGQQGNDTAFLGAGDDVFQWDPGDGSDIIEGGADHDTLLFNGSGGSEIFSLSPFGARLLFTRNLGSIAMDVDDVEEIDLNALGGTDTVTVNNLAGTDVTDVNVDLAGTIGGVTGDTQADIITVNATAAPDTIDISPRSGNVVVTGLSAAVRIMNSEPANDSLIVNGLGGVDTITSGPDIATLIMLTINQ